MVHIGMSSTQVEWQRLARAAADCHVTSSRMPGPIRIWILDAAFAMFALVAFVLAKLTRLPFDVMRGGEFDAGFCKLYQGGEEPEHIGVVIQHFINQFEMPVFDAPRPSVRASEMQAPPRSISHRLISFLVSATVDAM